MNNLNENSWKVLVLMLKYIAEEKGINQIEIANRTGLKKSNVSRVFKLDYCPTMRTFLLLAVALEANIFIEDKNSSTDLSGLFERAMTDLGRRPAKLPKN